MTNQGCDFALFKEDGSLSFSTAESLCQILIHQHIRIGLAQCLDDTLVEHAVSYSLEYPQANIGRFPCNVAYSDKGS